MRKRLQTVPADGAKYEAGELLSIRIGIPLNGLRGLLSAGHLRAIKVGRRTLFDVEHAMNWLASQPEAKPQHAPRKAT
jgi:hypothetical protein